MLAVKKLQERGYALEKFLYLLFGEYEVDPRPSFRTNNEQIDGSFSMNGDTILIEAKFKNRVDFNEFAIFQLKLDKRAYAKGLFITYSPIDDLLIENFKTMGKAIRFIITVQEIWDIIDNQLDLKTVIEKKFRILDEELQPYCYVRLM